MKEIVPPPGSNQLAWFLKNPQAMNEAFDMLRRLTKMELFVRNEKGAVTRVPLVMSRENSAIEVTIPKAEPAPNANDEDDGDGDVFGPPSATPGNIAVFTDSTGKRIRDGGPNISSIGRHTLWVPAKEMTPSAVDGCAPLTTNATDGDADVNTLDFDATASESAQFLKKLPMWDGNPIAAVAYFTHGATSVNFNVLFSISALALADGEDIAGVFGMERDMTGTGGDTLFQYLTAECVALTPLGTKTADSLLYFIVKRINTGVTGNLAIDAKLIGVRIFYTTNAANEGNALPGDVWDVVNGAMSEDSATHNVLTFTTVSAESVAINKTPIRNVRQFSKVRFSEGINSQFPGVAFRYTDAASPFYQVYYYGPTGDAKSKKFEWQTRSSAGGTNLGVTGGLSGTVTLADGDVVGFTIAGSSTSTHIRGFLNPAAAAPESDEHWDPGDTPIFDFTYAGGGGAAVDTGGYVGVVGGTTVANSIVLRDFFAGVCPAPSAPPSVVSVATDGTNWTFTFSQVVTIGAGGSGGFSASMTAGAVTLTYVSGSGSSALVFSGSRNVGVGETGTAAYVQPGNGIENTGGIDLASFSGQALTNTSTLPTFTDDFNRADGALGSNWTVANGAADINSNAFRCQTGGFTNNFAVWAATTGSISHYVKVQITAGLTAEFVVPFVFRYTNASSPFYIVYCNPGASTHTLVWQRYATAASSGVGIGSPSSALTFTNGDYLGFTVEQTGNNTVVRVWVNPTGAAPDSVSLWGGAAPAYTFTDNPTTPVDTGGIVGIGGAQSPTNTIKFDNFSAGPI
jgi:hypothetical protein